MVDGADDVCYVLLSSAVNCYPRPEAPEQALQTVYRRRLQLRPRKQLPCCLFTPVNRTCSAVMLYAVQ